MDDKLKHLIEQNKGYITRKQIIGNRYLYYQLLESVKLGEIIRLKPGVYCIDDAMALLIHYMQERLLYRLAQSKYKHCFYLKGGALLYAHEHNGSHFIKKSHPCYAEE